MKLRPKLKLLAVVLLCLVFPAQAFAALQYVGGITGNRNGSNSQGLTLSLTALTGGISSSAATGDIVIAVVSTGSGADRSIGIDTPTDFTETFEGHAGSTADTNISVSWKIMTATPDTSIVTSPSGNSFDALSATIHVWRYVDTGTPFDVGYTYNTGAGTGRPIPPAITPSSSGAIIIPIGAGATDTTGAVYTTATLSNFITDTGVDTHDSMTGMGSFAWSSGTYTPARFDGGTTDTGDSVVGVTIVLRPARVPTVTTQDATSIGATSATFNGNITATGGINPTIRGFAWGTSATMVGDTATTTENGNFGAGAFTDSAQTLTCATTYYYRPYAVNSVGTSTGPVSNSFNTSACPIAPTVTTNFANPGATTASLYGTKTGGDNTTQHGFAYGTNANLSGGDTATTTLGALTSNSSFSSGVGGLLISTTYYFRAYATNAGGTGYGIIRSFITGNTTASRILRLFEGFRIKFTSGKIILHQKQ